ncbi:MAG TPA: hypothetical protein PLF50_01435 [Candidatus Cloacimonadota bacterium]|nr:hypothetical protein [Candidatus Cloacimonadota bacterium]
MTHIRFDEDCISKILTRYGIILELNRIIGFSNGNEKSDAKCIRQLCDGLLAYPDSEDNTTHFETLSQEYSEITKSFLIDKVKQIKNIVREGLTNEGVQYESYTVIDINKRKRIFDLVNLILSSLTKPSATTPTLNQATSDTPQFFSKFNFRYRYLEDAMSRDEENTSRARDKTFTSNIYA